MVIRLETPRLKFTPLGDIHFDLFKSMIQDPFIREYLCDGEIFGDQIIQDFIKSSKQSFKESNYGLWLIQSKDDSAFIGFTGLRTFFEESQPQLIYALFKSFTGKGYASEASKQVIKYCFNELNFDYLIAACDAPNIASQKVALKLGMHQFKQEVHDGLATYFFKIEK